MVWSQSPDLLEKLEADPARQDWLEWEAGQHFNKIEKLIPAEMRDRARIGSFAVGKVVGLEGLQCWMQPIEGQRKLLSPKSYVALFETSGNLLFRGLWEAVALDLVRERPKFYLWLEPRRVDHAPIPWRLKALGAFRLLRHRLRKK